MREAPSLGPTVLGGRSVHDLYEARRSIEVPCARLAATRATHGDLERIRGFLETMRSSTRRARAGAELALHLAVARACDNPILVAMLASLTPRIRRVSVARANGVRTHVQLVEALEARDPGAAARAMERCLTPPNDP